MDLKSENNRQSMLMEMLTFPNRILVDLHGGNCNLNCPKCVVHGNGKLKSGLCGHMSLDQSLNLLKQISIQKPLLQPCLWSEPLLAKNFREHLKQILSFGLVVAINTNGLLLSRDMARFLVESGVSSVFVSIDATTPEVLEKVRGTKRLDQIENAVFNILNARNGRHYPRVGVSFTIEAPNKEQVDGFIAKWINLVDVIRVNACFDSSTRAEIGCDLPHRIPCGSLYETMAVHFNGNVSICCQDGHQKTFMGNIFTKSVEEIWNGSAFARVRQIHENGEYDRIPICKDCIVWATSCFEDSLDSANKLLIRKSPLITYYNRLDSMHNFPQGSAIDRE